MAVLLLNQKQVFFKCVLKLDGFFKNSFHIFSPSFLAGIEKHGIDLFVIN